MKIRERILNSIASELFNVRNTNVLRVGVDGVDGAGKTTFADELTEYLKGLGASVIRASVDSFHNPRAVRYRLGRSSPEGFFADSYNYGELKRALLDPLGPLGSGRFRTAVFDHKSDSVVSTPELAANPGSILVFDGIFLHRSEIRQSWDYSVFLEVDFNISIPRGAQRGPGFGSPDTNAPENHRYIEGQRIYLQSCKPQEFATLVIDNNDLETPFITKRNEVAFASLDESYIPLLRAWLKEPHVSEFWQEPEDESEFREKYLKKLHQRGVVPEIILWSGKPIGYIQHYDATKVGGGWWPDTNEGTFGIDQIIGDPDFINKGLGTKIIRKYVTDLFQNPNVKEVITDPDPRNLRAIHTYEKVGFLKVGPMKTPGGDAILLRIEREELK